MDAFFSKNDKKSNKGDIQQSHLKVVPDIDKILEEKIERLENKYKNARNDKFKGSISLRISQSYYKRATLISDSDDVSRKNQEYFFEKNAEWLGKAYITGKPSACFQFANTLLHKDSLSHAQHHLAVFKKLKHLSPHEELKDLSGNDEENAKKLLSYSFKVGERHTSWIMSQAIEFKDHPGNALNLEIIKKANIPPNDKGQALLLTVSSLGGHLKASKKLHDKIKNDVIDQETVDEIFKDQKVDLFALMGWSTKVAENNESFSNYLTGRFTKEEIDFLKSKSVPSEYDAKILKHSLLKTYNSF